jgi:probable HAF family extracellular repeat protein
VPDLGTRRDQQLRVDINDAGQVVGHVDFERAFLWTAAGGMVDLGTGGHLYSNAVGINDAWRSWAGSTVSQQDARGFVDGGGAWTDVECYADATAPPTDRGTAGDRHHQVPDHGSLGNRFVDEERRISDEAPEELGAFALRPCQ